MSASDYVVLREGPTLPLAAVQLAWRLEDKGCALRFDGQALLVGPGRLLTDDDRRGIVQWRRHLIALATYESNAVQ
jgi:hypothetical protein